MSGDGSHSSKKQGTNLGIVIKVSAGTIFQQTMSYITKADSSRRISHYAITAILKAVRGASIQSEYVGYYAYSSADPTTHNGNLTSGT